MNRGIFYAASAYLLWGLLPVFWKSLQHVPALEILTHRMVWSLGVVLLLLALRRHWRWLREALNNKRVLLTSIASALLLSVNWFVYIWAVNHNYILETSLGYFINPLFSVLLGVLFLKERLRPWQAVAILVALIGVLYMTISYGALPWIALALAGAFGFYGLLRKTASLNSLEGLTLETLIIFPPALGYLLFLEASGHGSYAHADLPTSLLLMSAGAATAGPLLLFSAGARRIPLTLVGILQYLAPTIQFLLGVFVYSEPMSLSRLIGFCFIWLALIIYTLESVLRTTRTARQRSAASKAGHLAGGGEAS